MKEDTAELLAVFRNPHTSMKKVRRAWPRKVHKVCNADKNVYPPKYEGDDDETFGAMKYFMLLCRGREKNKLVQVSALTDMDDDDEEKTIMLIITFVNALNDSAWDPVESKLEPQIESVPHASILRYMYNTWRARF